MIDLKNNLNLSISKLENLVINLPTITNKKQALLIGINYTGTQNQLEGCINDINAMETRLMQTGFNNFVKLLLII